MLPYVFISQPLILTQHKSSVRHTSTMHKQQNKNPSPIKHVAEVNYLVAVIYKKEKLEHLLQASADIHDYMAIF